MQDKILKIIERPWGHPIEKMYEIRKVVREEVDYYEGLLDRIKEIFDEDSFTPEDMKIRIKELIHYDGRGN